MNIRVYRKPEKKRPRPNKRPKYDGPTTKSCRPKLIYSIDKGKAKLTSSKWFPNPYTAIYDWLQRGFVVIEDETMGGGFEWRDFPDVDEQALAKELEAKINKKKDK